jgi:lipoyl-dependent peroxiredoxin
MITRSAQAEWKGSLKDGGGRMKLGSGAWEGPYGLKSRFEDGPGSNPEELIGAAHAGCFTMALTAQLSQAGHAPTRIATTAKVHMDKKEPGWTITSIELETEGEVPGIDEKTFVELAEKAKAGCPISRALAAVSDIRLKATLRA